MIKHPLLALVGMPGSGKSRAVEELKKRGWPVVYFGGITMDEVKRRGLPRTPDNEKMVREAIRVEHGLAAYAKLSLPALREHLRTTPTVADGLYSWDEYKLLRANLDSPLYVIAICTDRHLRYSRVAVRKERPLTAEQAEKRDVAEIENIQKGGPIAMADYFILNNEGEVELCAAVNRVADKIIGQGGNHEK